MNKILLSVGEEGIVRDNETEIIINGVGYGNVLILCDAEYSVMGAAHALFHDSSQFSSTSIINPLIYGDLIVRQLLKKLVGAHESYPSMDLETYQARFNSLLIGGCRPIVGSSVKKLHDSELDISPRVTERIKSDLSQASIPVRWELTGGDNLRSIHLRMNHIVISERFNLRGDSVISNIAINFPEWRLTQDGNTKILK